MKTPRVFGFLRLASLAVLVVGTTLSLILLTKVTYPETLTVVLLWVFPTLFAAAVLYALGVIGTMVHESKRAIIRMTTRQLEER